jgi:hypothetical protein
MDYPGPAALKLTDALVESLAEAARLAAIKAVHLARPAPRRRARGQTLRPGAETPLWNALVAEVTPFLKAYGARALLARELGVHGSRVTEFFVRRKAMPDAERTLELIAWLGRQRYLRAQADAIHPKRKNP